MAISEVQSAIAQNGLAQTFNVVLGAAPTEGNLLVAMYWHDRSAGDVENNPGSGYTRLNTVGYDLSGFTYQASVFAKFAGAGESATTLFDFGEVNRRGHGHMVEFTGQIFTSLQSADTAEKVDAERDPAGTTLQVGPITIPTNLLAIAINGTNNSSPTAPNWSAESELTDIINLNANFRATGSAWAEGTGQTISPVCTWGSSRQATQILAIIGVPPPGSTVLKGSSFRVTPAS
jgi:hypothetical protein